MTKKTLLSDQFPTDHPGGAVIGSVTGDGVSRRGIDTEGVISIDNGALRIAPLVEEGFGRAGLAYGPFPSQPGLAFAVYMLNGHNTAQSEPLPETFVQRMLVWLTGSGTDAMAKRVFRWLWSGHVRRTLRQFRRWRRTAKGRKPVALLDENLAVGWFADAAIQNPQSQGHSFIMHALGPENGELWAGGPTDRTRAVRGVQNVPIYYVSVLRPGSILYCVASIDSAVGMSAHPWLLPVAIETASFEESMYVGVQQGVLGQIGWRLDTRVYGVRVAELPGFDQWWSGAHAADNLEGKAPGAGDQAEQGGSWQVTNFDAAESARGGREDGEGTVCLLLEPGAESSLIRVRLRSKSAPRSMAGLVWRFVDERNHWRLVQTGDGIEAAIVVAGRHEVVARHDLHQGGGRGCQLQVLDQGERLMMYVNGEPVADAWMEDSRLADATRVGVICAAAEDMSKSFQQFEAHPRQFRLPERLDMGKPWTRSGSRVVLSDDFSGPESDLNGRRTPVGQGLWERTVGSGAIVLDGEGRVCVQATQKNPCPDRTAYCVDWPHRDFADIAATITPPGTAMGQGQKITTGFILYQDADNYVIVNAWRSDAYGGGSVSSFFRFGGYEDIFDAIWTNVADRVDFGKPFRLRVACDGQRYLVKINEEAVLFRAFRDVYPDVARLELRRVGLVSNWEFGTDTGTRIENLVVRV